MFIGLDVGHHSVKAALVAANRRDVLGLVEEPLYPERQYLDEEADATRITQVVQRVLQPWFARPRTDCTLGISVQGEGPVGSVLELPALDKKQVEVALEAATVRLIPYPRSEAAVGVQQVSSAAGIDGRGTAWFVAVVRKQALDRLWECLQKCGHALGKAEIHVFPLVRAFAANHAPASADLEGLISVGSRLTTVVAVRGGCPVALRCIRVGGADFTYAHHMGLQTSWSEAERVKDASDATAREVAVEPPLQRWLEMVRKSVEAWSQAGGPGRPARLWLTGGSAAWKGLAGRVQEQVGIPVEIERWQTLRPPQCRQDAFAGSFGTAVGLCLP